MKRFTKNGKLRYSGSFDIPLYGSHVLDLFVSVWCASHDTLASSDKLTWKIFSKLSLQLTANVTVRARAGVKSNIPEEGDKHNEDARRTVTASLSLIRLLTSKIANAFLPMFSSSLSFLSFLINSRMTNITYNAFEQLYRTTRDAGNNLSRTIYIRGKEIS